MIQKCLEFGSSSRNNVVIRVILTLHGEMFQEQLIMTLALTGKEETEMSEL